MRTQLAQALAIIIRTSSSCGVVEVYAGNSRSLAHFGADSETKFLQADLEMSLLCRYCSSYWVRPDGLELLAVTTALFVGG